MSTVSVYHTGFREIPSPDIHYGRSNADFGLGFYLSDSLEFARRWAGERQGETTFVNRYTLHLQGLRVLRFTREARWFEYIRKNRAGYADMYGDYDVIIGPIANDTLYDTYGIITSGLLTTEEALTLLNLGNEYRQVVIKTAKAAAQLHWEGAEALTHEDIAAFRALLQQEEDAFQKSFGEALQQMESFAEIDEMINE